MCVKEKEGARERVKERVCERERDRRKQVQQNTKRKQGSKKKPQVLATQHTHVYIQSKRKRVCTFSRRMIFSSSSTSWSCSSSRNACPDIISVTLRRFKVSNAVELRALGVAAITASMRFCASSARCWRWRSSSACRASSSSRRFSA